NPDKDNFLGLFSMFTQYGICAKCLRLEDFSKASSLKVPFVTERAGIFIVVNKMSDDVVLYEAPDGKYEKSMDRFLDGWDVNVMSLRITPSSSEPDYRIHHRDQLFNHLMLIVSALAFVSLLASCYIDNGTIIEKGITPLLLLDILGIGVCYMLVRKQLKLNTPLGDKICSAFGQKGCDSVLNSPSSAVLGTVTLSEIGLGYFFGDILLLSIFPYVGTVPFLFTILSLPLTFWSIGYQALKVKRWCPLCLCVILVLWIKASLVMICSLLNGFESVGSWGVSSAILLLAVLIVHHVSKEEENKSIAVDNARWFNSIKSEEDVLRTILHKQPYYEVSDKDSTIVFGNKDSDVCVTVLTNPHCNPCARMHKTIQRLLMSAPNIKVRYIFTSFYESLKESDRYLVGLYLYEGQERAKDYYDKWFEQARHDFKSTIAEKDYSTISDAVDEELTHHYSWKARMKISGTPTILLNGYKLPDSYSVEDLYAMELVNVVR
ncbi:MAG: thioredoxin domain-containing protein, partial [Bacteroidales bacterium]|nr:thioredoxin domain-containing protein [Bacteroidales bacterium]